MSTNFPGALDTLSNPAATDGLTGHASQHANANDAIEALQTKVGADGSSDAASLDYKVAELNAGKMSVDATTDAVVEGAANLYFTAQRVRDVVLSGLSTATNAVISATDSVLVAFGKLQNQISDHLANRSNPHAVTKAQVGLGNADNTSDAAKPISTATQAALNGKLSASATTDAIAEGSSNLYFTAARVRGAVLTGLSTATNAVIAATDSVLTAFGKLQAQISGHTSSMANPHSVTKTQVGLGNVDNTADLNKPVSTATQAALALKAGLVSPAFTTPNIGVATGTSFNSITGLSSTTPVMDGTAAVGTGVTVARADHVHPTDTTRAPLNSPTFTGTVSAPSNFNATGAALNLQTGGTNRVTIDGYGNVLSVSPNGGLGYGPGAGGTVTQATSKSTAVTLNKPCGFITMNSASLAAGASVVFNLVSSRITDATDGVLVHGIWQDVTPESYRIEPVGYVAANTFAIRVTNITGAALAEAVCVGFAVIKGVSG